MMPYADRQPGDPGQRCDRSRLVFFATLAASLVFTLTALILHRDIVAYNVEVLHDPADYLELSQNLVDGRGFVSAMAGGKANGYRAPVYPLLMAAHRILFGAPWSIVFLQSVGIALTALLAYRIGRDAFGERIGFTAALLTGFEPFFLYMGAALLAEAVFIPLFLFVVYRALAYLRGDRSVRATVLIGVALGIATLTRQVSQFFWAVLLLWGLLTPSVRTDARRSLVHLLVLLVAFEAVLLPWQARNYLAFGVWSFRPTSNVGYNLYLDHASFVEELRHRDPARRFFLIKHERMADFQRRHQADNLTSLAVAKEMEQEAIPFLLANWPTYLAVYALAVPTFFFADAYWDVLGVFYREMKPHRSIFQSLIRRDVAYARNFLAGLDLGQVLIFLLGKGLWGLVSCISLLTPVFVRRLPAGPRREVLCLWMTILYFFAMSGPTSIPRYRLPVQPEMFLLLSLTIAGWRTLGKPDSRTPHVVPGQHTSRSPQA